MLGGTLPNEHSNKTTPNEILLYPEISESFSLHQRSSFFQWMASNTETHNCMVRREEKLRSNQFYRCLYQTPCWGTYLKEKVKRLQGPKVVDGSKETVFSRHHRTDMYMDELTEPVQVQSRHSPSTEKSEWTQSPTPSKKLFAVDAVGKGETSFPEWSVTGQSTTLQRKPHAKEQ